MKKLYFIGIAGSAMGNVAIACAQRGLDICGSDSGIYPPMSNLLAEYNIHTYNQFSAQNLEIEKPDLIIIGNSVSRGNPELEYVLNNRIPYTSMPALIHDELIDRNHSIVVSGTHGKTTTTSIIAWIFDNAGQKPGFLIGGVPSCFSTGCRPVPQELHNSEKGVFIIEGDEYDTAFFDKRSKFFHYAPSTLIINAIEFDHADIFNSLDDIILSFQRVIRLIPSKGLLLLCADDPIAGSMSKYSYSNTETFGFAPESIWRAESLRTEDNYSVFEVFYKNELLGTFHFSMSGQHNVRNALAGIATAIGYGIEISSIQKALKSFLPPKRRMEEIAVWNNCLIIDDFAHHPTAIRETIKGLKLKYPGRRIIACFEPRSNTTTRNIFQHELGLCFEGCAAVIIGPVNRPERYAEEERLNLPLLLQNLQDAGIHAFNVQDDQQIGWGQKAANILEQISQHDDIIAIMSNGNAGGLRSLLQH
jgi:UDP-N-acetylmuramate: L-alanyl-gamma-D-glutamyl-meso-diaminopimelate ligase